MGPHGDLGRLFAVGGHGAAVAGVQGDVYEAEPHLGIGPRSTRLVFNLSARDVRTFERCTIGSPSNTNARP